MTTYLNKAHEALDALMGAAVAPDEDEHPVGNQKFWEAVKLADAALTELRDAADLADLVAKEEAAYQQGLDRVNSLAETARESGYVKPSPIQEYGAVEDRGSIYAALDRAEDFILGFEDDDAQEGIGDLLAEIRAAKVEAVSSAATPRVLIEVSGGCADFRTAGDVDVKLVDYDNSENEEVEGDETDDAQEWLDAGPKDSSRDRTPQPGDFYWLDVPDPATIGTENATWKNVGEFPTKAAAVEFIRENIGHCDDDGNINLLTLGQR